jgi:hypothetical protein
MTIFIAAILLDSGKIECEPEWWHIVYVYSVKLVASRYILFCRMSASFPNPSLAILFYRERLDRNHRGIRVGTCLKKRRTSKGKKAKSSKCKELVSDLPAVQAYREEKAVVLEVHQNEISDSRSL